MAMAAGPDILEHAGSEVSYPTWGFGAKTKIYGKSLESGKLAKIGYQAGGASGNTFMADESGNSFVEGSFQTVKVRVYNENGVRAEVHTI